MENGKILWKSGAENSASSKTLPAPARLASTWAHHGLRPQCGQRRGLHRLALGFGRVTALHYHACTLYAKLYQIHQQIRYPGYIYLDLPRRHRLLALLPPVRRAAPQVTGERQHLPQDTYMRAHAWMSPKHPKSSKSNRTVSARLHSTACRAPGLIPTVSPAALPTRSHLITSIRSHADSMGSG
jgi:hypothetical protein